MESVVAGAAGSFHLLASVDGEVYARGTQCGDRRLYWAEVDGVTVAADRARTLAWLLGARPDPGRLAAGLALPVLPYPLDREAMWPEVTAVAPGAAVCLGRGGSRRTRRWWRPPPSDLPLAQAAPGVREALRAAVAARVRPGQVWGADLSGGMDSTSLCFLAAEAGARLVAVTLEWSAPGNQDGHFARVAAEHLPGLTHLTFPSTALPGHFTGIDERREAGDRPSALLRDRAQREELARVLAEHGTRRRLSGHGGDHVVTPPAAYLHPLLRRHPRTALRHTAAYRAGGRWPLVATGRQLLSGRPLRGWLAAQADALSTTGQDTLPECDWGFSLSMPSWATGGAREMLAGLLRQAAASGTAPLAPDRGRHAWIGSTHVAGTSAAAIADRGGAGMPVQMPFCDDAVIDACLRARPEEAGHPGVYKPLLTTAMDGIVPDAIRSRTTKDHCGQEWHAGLAAQRRTLAAWAEESLLAAAGVLDPDLLRRAVLAPGLLREGTAGLESTLGTEAWLRDLHAHPRPGYLKEHPRESTRPVPAAAQ
ncbi:hypothetical protein BS329_37670 [Amycolatopsis coloradensis]|uniref:Asparagine synthetase domain-containing protein n=1 Tax=Amycolatopsis coloradensis TaxID=76021 RepID=A0A1R0KFN1_9PSEU|nr:asparagine synthase-related protein [Amycolatopsis coloradensis]OLZ44157.1 hypothetical protein BS329_37670 [Amycolatopsis coloradensis]